MKLKGAAQSILRAARRLAPYALPHRRWLLLSGAMGMLNALVSVFFALLIRNIVDSAAYGTLNYQALAGYVALFLLSEIIYAAFQYAQMTNEERMHFSVRRHLFRSVLHAPLSVTAPYHSADLGTRMTSDSMQISENTAQVIPTMISTFVKLIVTFVIVWVYAPLLAVFSCVVGMLGAVLALYFRPRMQANRREVQDNESALRTFFQDVFSHLGVIKAFCVEAETEQKLDGIQAQRHALIERQARLMVWVNTAVSLLFSAGYLVTFVYCAWALWKGAMSYGTMTMFLTLTAYLREPLYSLAACIPKLIRMATSLERVEALTMLDQERTAPPRLSDAPPAALEFRDIGFAYGEKQVLRRLSADIAPGEMVALMGASGVGKTTLVSIALAFLTPGEGWVRLNGVPVTPESRALMAYVPPDKSIVAGTVRDNVCMGREADDDRIWAALRIAQADGFVRELSGKLEAVLGENGYSISTGQAQRIAIARAVLYRPALLILDEATAALDEATERKALGAIRDLPTRPTALIISHRPGIRAYCDHVIDLNEP